MSTATATVSTGIAQSIIAPAVVTLGFAEGMLKGVSPEQFGRHAVVNGQTIKANHPAWVFGHLSIYNCKLMQMLGRPEGVTANPGGWEPLFKNGSECVDDATGKHYPPMAALVKHYTEGTRAVIEVLRSTGDDVLLRPNPGEGRMKEMLPLVGNVVNFLLTAHPMSHLGQVSTWRRCIGLGSAM